jgi:hypothetical protein
MNLSKPLTYRGIRYTIAVGRGFTPSPLSGYYGDVWHGIYESGG